MTIDKWAINKAAPELPVVFRYLGSMNSFILRTALLIQIVLESQCAFSQDTIEVIKPDSLIEVTIGSYGTLDVRTASTYIRKFGYSATLSSSSGVSIFNALRGRVPGLSVPSYFADANSSGLRTGPFPFVNDALIVIDGVPFNNFISQYANLNAFDYSSITAFSNTSALNFLGGANSGALVLASKSGEGIVGPLFEFNAYATYAWAELNNPLTNQVDKVNEWYMANAIAYSQDFGSIDTRISYTAQKKFSESIGEPLIHYLKVNTGFVASPKLDLRLIVDGRYSQYDDTLPPMGSPPATGGESKLETFVNANLMVKYKLTSALTISSQVGISSYHSSLTITGQTFKNTVESTNTYNQANLVISGSKILGKKIGLSGFAGYQMFDQNFEQGTSQENDYYPYFMGQASITYDRRFNLSGSYRDGNHSNSYNSFYSAGASASSLSASLIFSDWIGKSFLSLGKIRASTGSHAVVPHNSFPPPDLRFVLFPDGRYIPYEVNNFETGLDMEFLKSRLKVTLNYYRNQESYSTNNFGVSRYLNNGWETDIRFEAVKELGLGFDTGVVLSNSISRFDVGSGTGQESDPYLRLGWLNELKLKSIRFTVLIESISNYTGYSSNTGFVSTSFTMLRDISLGIKLPDSLLGLGTRGATLSIVARNLAKFSGTGLDVDVASGLSIFQKSASINLNVKF